MGAERGPIVRSPAGTYTISHPVDLANPGRADPQRQQAVASQPRAALRAYHAGDRMASSPPRGALKRPAGTQNLLQTGSSSAFITHFLVSADDFKILLVKSGLRFSSQLHPILRHTCHDRAQKSSSLTRKATPSCIPAS